MGFLDLVNPISAGIGGVSSIIGLIQDGQARQRALQQQQQAMQQYGQSMDRQYQNILGHNSQTLMGAAGQGGTALTNYGSNLGAANAGAGVYNSSATSGALAQGQANTNQSLAALGAQNDYNANSFYNQGQQSLANMRLGQANTNYGNANQDYHNSQAGLGNFLGTLGQSNLLGQTQQGGQNIPDYAGALQQGGITDADLYGSRSAGSLTPGGGQGMYGASGMGALTQQNLSLGANAYRPTLPSMNGTQNQGANLGGNAGGIGNGGTGAGGSNPFYQPLGGRGYSQIVQNPQYGGPMGGR